MDNTDKSPVTKEKDRFLDSLDKILVPFLIIMISAIISLSIALYKDSVANYRAAMTVLMTGFCIALITMLINSRKS